MPNIISPRILGPYKKYATPTNLLIGTGLLVAAYLGYNYLTKDKKGKGGKNMMPKLALPGEVTNPRLEFNVTPPVLKPNSPSVIQIQGVFKGDDNQPSAASEGFYAIYDSNDNIITSGSLGKSVTSFKKAVQLPPLKNGEFTVEISDEIIETDDGSGSS